MTAPVSECRAECAKMADCEGVLVLSEQRQAGSKSSRRQAHVFSRERVKCLFKTQIVPMQCATEGEFDLHYIPARRTAPVASGLLTSAKCDALLTNKNDKMWKMFGTSHLQVFRKPADAGCFGGTAKERRRFWTEAISGGDGRGTGQGCDTNWIRGSRGKVGAADARPIHGPALLGFDMDIYEFCVKRRLWEMPSDLPSKYVWGKTQTLVDACLPSGLNFIRVMDAPSWTMCQNIEWEACVAQGTLPGQASNEAVFATAPKSLRLDEFRIPSEPCRANRKKSCDYGFASDDVFFFEVCFLSLVCRNRDALFRVDAGEPFRCDFVPAKFHSLRGMLSRRQAANSSRAA